MNSKVLAALALSAPAVSAAGHSMPCDPDDICISKNNVFTFAINPYCSSLGYYTVKECGDCCMPTLGMEQSVTHTFNQADDTNWMHPLGFAYLADGAHEGVDELEPGLQADWACAGDNACQAPMYFVNGEYVGKYSNIAGDGLTVTGDEDFGLDVYEPDFFLDRGEWKEKGPYEVKLTLTDKDFTADFFYFCHIHNKMSAVIKQIDSRASPSRRRTTPCAATIWRCPRSSTRSAAPTARATSRRTRASARAPSSATRASPRTPSRSSASASTPWTV